MALRERMIREPGSGNGFTRTEDGRPGVEGMQEMKARLHRNIINRMDLAKLGQLNPDQIHAEVARLVKDILVTEEAPLSAVERERLIDELHHELFGLGPLEPLLADHSISDILVNSPSNIYIERRGKLERTDVAFKDNEHLMRVIERIVSSVGRRIDESSPMVDARLKDGSRVNAIIPPLSLDGPVLSIRRFRSDRLGAQDLVARETLTQPILDFLAAVVTCRLNVIVSGGTGAGKTTMLNVLSGFISERERIITIEDAAELTLRQRHVVRLETRPPNVEGNGAVRQRARVINALRMRPDRIILGEVRGEEAIDM